MLAPAHHAEIVERKPRVDLRHDRLHALAHLVDLGVVGHDGVVVDDQLHAELFRDVALNVVDQLMRLQNVLARVQLHMDAGKAPAGAVVMDDQIVDAEHARVIAADLLRDGVDERLVRRLAEQRVDRVLGDAHARPQNEHRDQKPRPAVDLDVGK